MKLWSSQLWTQFLQLRKEAWKIQDFNGVWTRDLAIPVRRSNQLSYEATDFGSWSFVGSNVPVRNESTMKWYMKWIICEQRIWNQMKLWSSQLWVIIARSRVQTPLKSWIFQASLRNCKNCVHNCEDHSFIWFHIRSSDMIHFIHHFIVVLSKYLFITTFNLWASSCCHVKQGTNCTGWLPQCNRMF